MIIKKIESFVKSFQPHPVRSKSTGLYAIRRRNKYTLSFEYLDLDSPSYEFWWSGESSCFRFCLTPSLDSANTALNEYLQIEKSKENCDMERV